MLTFLKYVDHSLLITPRNEILTQERERVGQTFKGEGQNMTLVTVAWIAFGLGTTAGFLLARSVESVSDSIGHAEHDVAGN